MVKFVSLLPIHMHSSHREGPDEGSLDLSQDGRQVEANRYLLHLRMATLRAIAEEHQHHPHKCLIRMLETWLKRADPPPTWSTIIDAVEFLGGAVKKWGAPLHPWGTERLLREK